MVYASQWYSIISIASSSLALLTSAYVVRKIPNRRAGDTFVMAMLFFVLAGTFAYLLRTSTIDVSAPYPGALTIARLFYFFHMLAVGFTASFIGQYFLGFELMRRRLVNLFLQVSLLVVAIGVTVQVNTLRVEADYTYGYYGDVSTGNVYGVVIGDVWARASLALFATIFMSTALAVLIRTLIRNKDPIVRKQTLLMTACVVTHGIGAEWYATTRIFTALYPPPAPVLWLTVTLGQNHMPPMPPGQPERAVRDFVAAAPKAVIALEGIEYLATYVDVPRIVRCLHTLRDLATAGGGVLLVSADLGAVEEPITAVLERDFEPLELQVNAEYGVEDVFVIEQSGLLLKHASRSEGLETDPDVMAGMLTAIMNFARVSFAKGSDELRRLELGKKTVVIERSPRFILAVAVTGTAPPEIRAEMRIFLDRAERRYGPDMARWSGDPEAFPGLQAMTSRLFL